MPLIFGPSTVTSPIDRSVPDVVGVMIFFFGIHHGVAAALLEGGSWGVSLGQTTRVGASSVLDAEGFLLGWFWMVFIESQSLLQPIRQGGFFFVWFFYARIYIYLRVLTNRPWIFSFYHSVAEIATYLMVSDTRCSLLPRGRTGNDNNNEMEASYVSCLSPSTQSLPVSAHFHREALRSSYQKGQQMRL